MTSRTATQVSTSRGAMLLQPTTTSSPPVSTSLFYRGQSATASTTVISFIASLAYPTITITTLALCDKKNDTNNNNNDDEDFISKIRSKLESQSFSLNNIPKIPIDNETLNSIASSLGTQISSAISTGIPTDLSYGFFAGYLSGFALKKIGKVASITLGLSFLALQSLAYSGYIDVHHEKLQKQLEEMLDRNKDGVVDGEDIRSVVEEVRKVAGFGLEDNTNLMAKTGGFGLGFWGGLRSG